MRRKILVLLLLVRLLCPAALAAEYYLVERSGMVAAVTASGELYCLTDTPVSALLPADRLLLQEGLACENRAALDRALENFCS